MLFLIILAISLVFNKANYILSVNQTNNIVNAQNQLSISIKTSTPISNNSLIMFFDQTYTINNSTCIVNSTSIPCDLSINSTTLQKILDLGMPFLNNTVYLFTINVINPYYSNNFLITANNLNTPFLSSGTATVNP